LGLSKELPPRKFNIREQVHKIFEPQLIALGLDKRQIEIQDLSELYNSLEIVNDAIQRASDFGLLKIEVCAEAGFIVTKVSSAESHFKIGILPLLLESKKFIIERIKRLEAEAEISELKEKEKVTVDKDDRIEYEKKVQELQLVIENLENNRIKGEEQLNQAEQALKEAQSAAKQQELEERKERFRLESWERRTRLFQSFLECESVATIVGGLLLIIVTLFLIVFTFLDTKALDILSNAFLVILGYFFGQSVGKQAKYRSVSEPEDSEL
jgi:hypothetical protein